MDYEKYLFDLHFHKLYKTLFTPNVLLLPLIYDGVANLAALTLWGRVVNIGNKKHSFVNFNYNDIVFKHYEITMHKTEYI